MPGAEGTEAGPRLGVGFKLIQGCRQLVPEAQAHGVHWLAAQHHVRKAPRAPLDAQEALWLRRHGWAAGTAAAAAAVSARCQQ